MITLTREQIKELAEIIESAADAKTEESGTVSIDVPITLNNEPYLIVGEVEVFYSEQKKVSLDYDSPPETDVEFKITDFNLELQHLHDDEDVQQLDWKRFKEWL
jgi:hypothetical protein